MLKKNILLINPSANFERKQPELSTGISNYVPLSIITVAQHYLEIGYVVKVLDSRTFSSTEFKEKVTKEIKKYDTIGISVNTYTIQESIFITKIAKLFNKKVIWGGIHPRLYPEQCKKIADDVFVGDLEPKSILPAYDLLDIEKYIIRTHKDGKVYRVLDIQLTRGCPYRCAFCINPIFHGKKYKIPNIDEAKKAVRTLIEKYNLNHVVFLDENFFVNQKFAELIIKSLPEHVTFTADCRANYFKTFSKNLKTLLKDKCLMLSIGGESGSQRVLDFLKKDIKIHDIEKANDVCHELNIMPNFSFMIGIPTETIEEMKQTMKFILKLKSKNPLFYYTPQQPFRPYPGCELYDYLKKGKFIKEPKSMDGWINFNYENELTWFDEKTKKFINKLVFYSGKARMPGTKLKSKAAYKIANFRINHDFYIANIEMKIANMK